MNRTGVVLVDEQIEMGPVPLAWQEGYIDAVERLGGDVTVIDYLDDDHFSLPGSSVDDAREWLSARC